MNKKFLSAILFGALAVASTGSFVSCQDYDDEIDNLQSQINGLASAKDLADKVSQLQAEIAAAKEAATKEATEQAKQAIEKLDKLSDELNKTMAELDKKTKEQLEAQKEEISKQLDSFKKQLDEAISGFSKSLKSLVFQPELYLDGIEAAKFNYLHYVALTENKDTWVTDPAVNDLGNKVELASADALKKLGAPYTTTQYFHTGNILNLVEAATAPNVGDNYIGTPKSTGDIDVNEVKFALNPSTAEVTLDQAKMIINNVVATTRADKDTEHNTVPEVEVTAVNVEKGILTISYKIVKNVESLISANHAESEGHDKNHKNTSVFQAVITNADNAVINSDWAMLYEEAIQPVAIAWNKTANVVAGETAASYCNLEEASKNACPELYKNVFEALKAKPSLSLGYNDKKGIDLTSLIELHMIELCEEQVCLSEKFKASDSYKHNNITLAEAEEKYGLTVEFAPVAYIANDGAGNKTQPSNYLDPAKITDGIALAGMVDAEKGTFVATTDDKGVSSVGKQPLVQVLVKKDKDVVLEGYIKLQITRFTEDIETPVIDLGEKKYDCKGLDFGMTWSQASTYILEETMGMDKETFDKNYKLLTIAGTNGAAKQFVKKDGKVVEVAKKDMFAVIWEGIDETSNTNTVLHVGLDQYAQQYILEKLGGEADFIVKYAPATDNDPAKHQYEPGVLVNIHISLVEDNTLLAMKTKLTEYWYSADGALVQDPDEALRANVMQAVDNKNSFEYYEKTSTAKLTGDDRGFYRKVTSAFEVGANSKKNDVVLVNGTKPYASVWDVEGLEKTMFYFHPAINNVKVKGDDGKTYQLSVENDFVMCNIWVSGGAEYKSFDVKDGDRVLQKEIKGISAKPLEYVNELAQEHKLASDKGIFANKTLYCSTDGNKTKEAVAKIDNYGEIHYLYNEMSKGLLNAKSHIEAEAKAFVGVYAMNSCKNVVGVTDGIFPVYFYRPLDLDNPKAKEVVDAKTNGSKTSLADLLAFQDWRDIKINTTVGNGNLLAFYGVKTIKIDLGNMTTDMNGHDITKTKLEDVTKDVQFQLVKDVEGEETVLAKYYGEPSSYSCTAELDDYNVEAKYGTPAGTKTVFAALFGGDIKLRFDNNGLNSYNWSVRIPVTVGYDWGSLVTYVDVKIVETIANGGE